MRTLVPAVSRALRLPAGAALATLAACAGKAADSDDGLPHIRIVAPADGGTVPTCLNMTVEVDNFDIVPPADHPDNVDGQGHWHMKINDKPLLIPCEDLTCAFDLDGFDDGPLDVVAVLADNTYVELTDAAGAPVADSAHYTLAGDDVRCD